MPPAGRVLHLDLLRAVAILLVVGSHTPTTGRAASWGQALLETWQRCGWAGVDLFFALSGYLIVGLLLAERERTGTIDVGAFVWRRVFKIYPPYVLFLGAAVAWSVYSGATPGAGATVAAFWPTAAHLQNYILVDAVPHLWSLAMEEHCYTLMLGLVLVASRRGDPLRSRTIPLTLLAVFGASWLGRWAYVLSGYSGTGSIGLTYTHNRLDAVLAGSLVAWLVQHARAGVPADPPVWERHRRLVLAVSAICFVPTLTLDIASHRPLVLVGVLPLQAFGFGLLLLGLSQGVAIDSAGAPARGAASWLVRALALVGISSYSTYLWHYPFAVLLTRMILHGISAGPLPYLVVFIAIAIGAGAASYFLVERPALAWRRRVLAARRIL